MFKRAKKSSLILLLIMLVSGCSTDIQSIGTSKAVKLLQFNGEGEVWEINNYQIKFTSDNISIGNGELVMKNVKEYSTTFLSFEVHSTIDNKDEIIHKFIISGEPNNIAYKEIGKIDGAPYIDKKGKPRTSTDFKDLYVIIDWKDSQGNEKREIINLVSSEE